ncbi:MAG TPA: Gfo/Idh/MocA family oxidoreductase, partial [Vicinamibacteria bacterium]|nr:Gfo/Idh/MocA family oxidoreductase [Vicinamibacteria bacterium]
ARVYADLPGARLVGVYDIDASRAASVAERHGCPVLDGLQQVIDQADAVSVAVPTVDHHRVARALMQAGRDVLVEKPVARTVGEAEDLIGVAGQHGVILQVGHVERFNPAVDVLRREARSPRFIEVHRLGSFSARSLDIDVVMDLMVHDLDIVLSLDPSDLLQVDAVGVAILTPRVDIANARLRFASGLIANLTASRVSMEKVRKFRVFAPRTYISVDFARREAQVHRLEDTEGGPEIRSTQTAAPDEEPLRRELAAFVAAVRGRSTPVVTGEDGLRALRLAQTIVDRIAEQNTTV